MRARRIGVVALPVKQLPSGTGGSNPSARTIFASWGNWVAHRILVPGSSGSNPDEAAAQLSKAPFGYGIVSRPFKAEKRVRVPHGVPVSGSSVGSGRRSDTAEAGGSIPPRTTAGGRR